MVCLLAIGKMYNLIRARRKATGFPVRFCTNETTTTRKNLVDHMQKLGFSIKEEEVFSPPPAVSQILRQRGYCDLLSLLIPVEGNVYNFTVSKFVLSIIGDGAENVH